MTTGRDLVCPKCGGRMRTYERSEIVVEQCEDCRGIFLDQGELERLVDAEGGGWSGTIVQPSAPPEDHGDVSRSTGATTGGRAGLTFRTLARHVG